nr:GyrI-like domain-containing protein [Thiomonas sp. FB-Cd]
MQIRIVEFQPTCVAPLSHWGAPGLVNASVQRFIAWPKQSGQSPVQSSRTFGIPHGNPDTAPPDEFRFDTCVDISVIALWLGHESPATTHQYVEADLAMKERALARLQEPEAKPRRYRAPDSLIDFLRTL